MNTLTPHRPEWLRAYIFHGEDILISPYPYKSLDLGEYFHFVLKECKEGVTKAQWYDLNPLRRFIAACYDSPCTECWDSHYRVECIQGMSMVLPLWARCWMCLWRELYRIEAESGISQEGILRMFNVLFDNIMDMKPALAGGEIWYVQDVLESVQGLIERHERRREKQTWTEEFQEKY